MDFLHGVSVVSVFAPIGLMAVALLVPQVSAVATVRLWQVFTTLSFVALVCTLLAIPLGAIGDLDVHPWLHVSALGASLAALVQLLGTVVGVFSARYLQGEPGQRHYVAALAGVLATVHLLLMANHWVVLILAWALVGVALQRLLCFYPDRPFALLAAYKKRMGDRLADVLLVLAAALAWSSVGSGSLSDLWAHVERQGMSLALDVSAVCLVLAVALRTALLPVHGWLIQVMEAPTPVSALLHAGVVNLGGYVLIRFAPVLEHASPARWLLVALGLGTALLAGLVMLTRVSIKVRLAWSTVAQMGFMVLECGLGLYTLAALHLIGHSLYKVHAFLGASTAVRQTRLQAMRGAMVPSPISLVLAPILVVPVVVVLQMALNPGAWPWWWSCVLGLAWAPLLWLPTEPGTEIRSIGRHLLLGLFMAVSLTAALLLAHNIPFGIHDTPDQVLGMFALLGMTVLYVCLVVLQRRPQALATGRRWSYAGFYLDEFYTRLALRLWPAGWNPDAFKTVRAQRTEMAQANVRK